MIKKKNSPDANNDMPVVPSISNIDELTSPEMEEFPFPESDAEPEAVLEIPSFSGLDTLDVATAVTQTIHEVLQDAFHNLPEIPDYAGESVQKQLIPSFLDSDTETQDEQNADEIIEFENFADTENIPEIPSFADQSDQNASELQELENLPDISDFMAFSQDTQHLQDSVQDAEMTIPERPQNVVFQGDLQEAAKDILMQVPSVSDLSDLDMLGISGVSAFPEESFLTDSDENSYLPEIPSVSDDNWEEKIEMETKKSQAAGFFFQNSESEEAVPIAELPLSLNALHYLQRIEIHDSLELLEASKEALEAIPEIDAKTLREILHVRQLQKQNQAQIPSQQPVSEEFERLLDAFLKDLELIGVSEKRQIRLKAYLRAVNPEQADRQACFAAWYHEPHVQLQLDKYITGLLRKRQMSGLSVNMLAESLPPSLDREILSGMLRDMLSADRLIESRDGFYTLKYPPVLKFLADNTDEKEQHIQVLRQRMDGMTLEEIARQMETSPEHVLEIQNRTLRLVQKLCLINRTSVYEERFRPFYENYDLDQKIFQILTKESEQVFRYLELVAFPGSKSPEEVPTDMGVPGWVRENWQEYLKKNHKN